MKITIRQRWEEIEPLKPNPLDYAFWLALFSAGFVLGAIS